MIVSFKYQGNQPVTIAKGEQLQSTGSGDIPITLGGGNVKIKIRFPN
jgi:hypothetical protein